ncbi:hypothetical protein [Helicobacter pylori]|uniref:hypothetical protein n=1 Tax=Helicobacter pylori TaxID=210 RepID=UPI001E54241C|nr:hypothetical protein [Helicobacter pylori]
MVSNTNDFRGVFGEVLDTVKDTFGNLLQLLTNLKNKEIEFDFHKKINYGLPFGIIFITSNSDNPIDIDNKTKKLESCFRDTIKHPFCNYRVDSEQNLKINEIVEGLKSGKIIGKKIISNAFDLNASYCFITPDGLKNLKERLFIDIINVINQKKRVALNHAQLDDIQYKEGVALDYALINDILINDIKYNLLDNTFHFIFDIDLHLIDD